MCKNADSQLQNVAKNATIAKVFLQSCKMDVQTRKTCYFCKIFA